MHSSLCFQDGEVIINSEVIIDEVIIDSEVIVMSFIFYVFLDITRLCDTLRAEWCQVSMVHKIDTKLTRTRQSSSMPRASCGGIARAGSFGRHRGWIVRRQNLSRTFSKTCFKLHSNVDSCCI